MDTASYRLKPIVVCQYGKECNRVDPDHFMEYNHEHLEELIGQSTTVNDVKQYQLPDDITLPKDLVWQQIEIVRKLFPNESFKQNQSSRRKSCSTISFK